jgi:CRP/FNR family transcriptional regulator
MIPQHSASAVGRAQSIQDTFHRTRLLSFVEDGPQVASCLASAITLTHTWESGHHLVRVGDGVRSLYLVRSGAVKNYVTSEDGDEQVLGFFLPGEILGLEAVKSFHHGCSAVVLETSSICELPLRRLENLPKDLGELQAVLTEVYASVVARNYAALCILGKKSADQRLAGFLLDLSERYAERGFSDFEYHLSMSRRDIGNYLGLALGTVSRLLSEFEAKGLLDVHRRHIRLLNVKDLRTLAGNCS